jgi:hypothetical protein
MYVSADDLLKAKTFRYGDMDLGEWGLGILHYRTISGADRERWAAEYSAAQAAEDPNRIVGQMAKLIALSSCDADGKRLLTDAQVMEFNEAQAGDFIQKVFDVIAEHNKVALGAVEREGKDSPAPPASGISSDSASGSGASPGESSSSD